MVFRDGFMVILTKIPYTMIITVTFILSKYDKTFAWISSIIYLVRNNKLL